MESGTVWSEMTGTVWSEMGGTVWSVIAICTTNYVRKNFTGIRNFYMCMQIAHLIDQLFVLCKNRIMQGWKTLKGMWKQLWATIFLVPLEQFPQCEKLKLNYRY